MIRELFSTIPDYEELFSKYSAKECQIDDMERCMLNEDGDYVKNNIIVDNGYEFLKMESSFYHQVTLKSKVPHIFVP